MLLRHLKVPALLAALALPGSPVAAAPAVVASIQPIHSLASAVMQGVAEPRLLIEGAASPHAFSLRPSDARALADADLVIWIGPELEVFLQRPLESLGLEHRTLTLSEAERVNLLPVRDGEREHDHAEDRAGEAHDHHDHHHAPGAYDMHLWLSPDNAQAIVGAIAAALEQADPDNAERYQANAAAARKDLEDLEARLARRLEPFARRSFITFHDAYQYFEEAFHLQSAGAIALSPERQPGARRIAEIRDRILAAQARCVFAEPQFAQQQAETVVEGTGARIAFLDPLGATLKPGPGAYSRMMEDMAESFAACFEEAAD